MVNPYRQAVLWHTIVMALIAPALTLRRFNNFLTVMVVVIGAYIMLTPFLPAIQWWSKYEAPIVSSKPTVPTPKATSQEAPQNNSLFIPALAMQEAVHEGASRIYICTGIICVTTTKSVRFASSPRLKYPWKRLLRSQC